MNFLINKTHIRTETMYLVTLLTYICILYAFFEYRLIITPFLVIMLVFYYISRRKSLSLFTLWNFIFIIWCIFSLYWSHFINQTLIESRILVEIAIINNLVISFLDKEKKLNKIYSFFIFAGLILIIRLAFEFPINTWFDGRLGSSLYFNPNRIGIILAISAIFVFHFANMKNKIYYIIFLFFTIVIFLTGSRKAFIMVIFGSGLLFYLNKGRGVTKKIYSIPIIILMMFLGYYTIMNVDILYEIIGVRIEALISSNDGGDRSITLRKEMIDIGKQLFLNKPFLGYGIGSYSVVSGYYTYSHNNYIEILVGLGIIGLLIYYSMIVYLIIKLYNQKQKIIGNPMLVILLLLLIMDYGLVSYNGFIYQLIIAISYAALKVVEDYKYIV